RSLPHPSQLLCRQSGRSLLNAGETASPLWDPAHRLHPFAAVRCNLETEGTMIRLLCGVVASMGLLALAGTARADEKQPANDREFVVHAANGGHAEVKLGELAEKRAANPKVKEFAARMIKDHTAANKKLVAAAKNQRVAVVAGFDRESRKMFMELSKLQG